MGRPAEQKADFFPHYVGGGVTLRALERAYGNDGYAFWFKLLETLCESDGQFLDLQNDARMIDFAGYVRQPEEWVREVIALLVRLGQVDADLWTQKHIVWVQGLVDNLASLYAKRTCGAPQKPSTGRVSDTETDDQTDFRRGNNHGPGVSASLGVGNPQSRVEESRVEESNPLVSTDVLTSPQGEGDAVAGVQDKPGKPAKTDALAGFNAFWHAYPRKVAKVAAQKAWAKIKPDLQTQTAMLQALAAARQSDEWRRDGGQYIPHPMTWLNRRRWEDEPLELPAPPDTPPNPSAGSGYWINGVEMGKDRFDDEVRYTQTMQGVSCGFDDDRHFWCRRDAPCGTGTAMQSTA